MLKLKSFIKEEKNVHMEHLCDLPFNEGVDGTRKAINFLQNLRDMLAGNAASKVTATVKWDGAPAIFAGIDPRDGKFFVAKKGIFNKSPKIYKTPAEIKADLSGELADKFLIALKQFSKLGITKGIYQGDLMFTKGDVKKQTIQDVKYVTFHPNTIVYAVPVKSELGSEISQAEIGVVWHTTYTGKTFETMTASFGKGIVKNFKKVPGIWMDDATYKDYSGTATFTQSETKQITSILSKAGSLFKEVDANILNSFKNDADLLLLVKTFNNSKIKANEKITDPKQHEKELFHYIYDKYQKQIDDRKTDKSKDALDQKRKNILSIFNKSNGKLAKVFELTNLLVDAKHMIIDKMNQASEINTFLKTKDGFKATGVEGFVAIDHLTGGAVKIVNRMEFSKANFSPEIIKGWQR